MPYIKVDVTCPMTSAKRDTLYEKMGVIAQEQLNRSAAVCMMEFTGGHTLYYRGCACESAFVELHVLGEFPAEAKAGFISAVTALLAEEFLLSPEYVVVNILELPQWGSAGKMRG